MTAEAPRATRTRKPWTADFERVKDELGEALGAEIRYVAEDGELYTRGESGLELLAEALMDRRDAYHWMRGRLAAEEVARG